MKNYTNKNLNLKRLLEIGDLDIRGIAARDETISADEYCFRVESFIENAPQTDILLNVSKIREDIQALKELESKLGVAGRAENFDADNKYLQDLEGLKSLLAGIGYGGLDFEIDSICIALKNNDLALAEKLALDASNKFGALYNRTKSAHSLKKFAKARKADSKESVKGNEILLYEALEYLDYEESNRKMRVLAVDDVSVVLNTISSVLSPYYEVYAIKKSSQVKEFLEHTTPELFLLDIEMDGINGFELVPIIRQFEKHKDTPIIFLTGNASVSNLRDALAVGACDFITKPVERNVLIEKIEKNIVRKKLY